MANGAVGAREGEYYTPRALIVATCDAVVSGLPGEATPAAGRLLTKINRLESIASQLRLVTDPNGTVRDPVAEVLVEAFGFSPRQAALDSAALSWHVRADDVSAAQRASLTIGASALSAGMPNPRELLDYVLPGVCIDVKDSSDRRGTWASVAALVVVWLADLSRLLERTLNPSSYEYADHAPPNANSPCGVLRLATPQIPRGPQLDLHLDAPAHPWALAA
ncbi:hypothetical protein ACFXJO_04595 [Streptomyces lavendulae]|uniref:hypothetical protein n=1 Tax=Streptomyces lavendulae TaxID=1914 RepID=UPI00369BE102